MKKFLALLMAGLMTVSMAACGGSDNEGADAPDSGAADGAKTYVIATDTAFPPFEYTNEAGEFVGIDVDIINAIAEDQGFNIRIDSLGFDAALAAVQSGQADGVIAGMSITDERKQKFDFSDPYYTAEVTMAVAKGSDIKGYEDLNGTTVAVKTGTNGADYAKSIADQYGFTVKEFKDSPTMYQDVISGNTAACFEDYPVMAFNIQQGAGLEMPEGTLAAGTDYGFAVNKGENAELLAAFQTGLANIKNNGKYQEIVDKYTK